MGSCLQTATFGGILQGLDPLCTCSRLTGGLSKRGEVTGDVGNRAKRARAPLGTLIASLYTFCACSNWLFTCAAPDLSLGSRLCCAGATLLTLQELLLWSPPQVTAGHRATVPRVSFPFLLPSLGQPCHYQTHPVPAWLPTNTHIPPSGSVGPPGRRSARSPCTSTRGTHSAHSLQATICP